MKNRLFCKFIALLLCAVILLPGFAAVAYGTGGVTATTVRQAFGPFTTTTNRMRADLIDTPRWNDRLILVHHATNNIMMYDSVPTVNGTANVPTSLPVGDPELATQGLLEAYYLSNNDGTYSTSRIYFGHHYRDQIMWISKQVLSSKYGNTGIPDATGDSSALSYKDGFFALGRKFGGNRVFHHAYLFKGTAADDSYWIESDEYRRPGMGLGQPSNIFITSPNVDGVGVDELYMERFSESDGTSTFVLYYICKDSNKNATGFYNVLKCNEDGTWGIDENVDAATVKANLSKYKVRLYRYKVLTADPCKDILITGSLNYTVTAGMEQSAVLEELASQLSLVDNYRRKTPIPYRATPTPGFYWLDTTYDLQSTGSCPVYVKYRNDDGTDTLLVTLNLTTTHDHSYSAVVTAPTCTEKGYTTYTCACGTSFVANEVAALGHSYTAATVDATCTQDGKTTYTCASCGDTVTETIPATGHSYAGGICGNCGAGDPDYIAPDYHLVGYINGADYGCEGDWENLGEYRFVDGKLTATFDTDSYIFIKTSDNAQWFMAQSYCTDTTCTFYNTSTGTSEKMFVPGTAELTFTLTENDDGSLTLSYTAVWPHSHSYEATVTAPTCTEKGYTTYTCPCGDSYIADETAALGHKFSGSTCINCGFVDTNESEPDPLAVPILTPKSFTLSFEDEILINFYYTVSDMTHVTEQGMLVFNANPADADIAQATEIFIGSTYVPSTGRYMNTTTGIAAKNLGDSRYYCAYAKLADGSYVYSPIHEYSPKKYAMNMLGKDTTSEKQKQLCVAMLNYGAAAQEYFGCNTDNLANAELTAMQKEMIIGYDSGLFVGAVKPDEAKTVNFTDTGFSKKTATVSFDGAFCINYYFTPSTQVNGDVTLCIWTPATYAAVDTLTLANAHTVTMTPGSDGSYFAQLSGIAAKNLDTTYYVAGVYTDAAGNTCSTGVIAYSLSKYCLSKAVPGNAMQALAEATAMYGYYAKQYFTN